MSLRKLNKKNKIILGLASQLVLFSEVLVVSAYNFSFLWLSSNKSVTANEISVKCNAKDIKVEYEIYQWDITTSLTTNEFHATNLNSDGNPIKLDNFALHQYDTIFEKMNKYTPSIIRINISGNDLAKIGTINLDITRSTSNNNLEKLDDYFSSIITFGAIIDTSFWDENKTNGTSMDKVFSKALEYFEPEDPDDLPTDNIDTFVEETSGEFKYSKKEKLTFSVEYGRLDFDYNSKADANADINGSINLYVYVNYNKNLIDKYKDDNGISIKGLDENLIDFADDIDSFKLSLLED